MAQDLSDVYTKHMRHHGCGMAMFQPIAHKDIEPPCCGYFDQNDKWNLIAKLGPKHDNDALGLTPLGRKPAQMRPVGLRWQPKCSKGVRMFNVDVSGKTPDLGIPVGADAHIKYQSKTSFGAVLIARNPVEVTVYNDQCLFKEWIDDNKARLYDMFGNQLKKHGLWIVTITYTAPGCSINAWMHKDKNVVLSAKAKAAMVGDLSAELQWTDKITDKDWCHYSAKSVSNMPKTKTTPVTSEAHAIRLVPKGSHSKSGNRPPNATASGSHNLKHTSPQRHSGYTSPQSPNGRPTRSLSRKQAIGPIGNHMEVSKPDGEITYESDSKSPAVTDSELSPVSSHPEKADVSASRAATPVKYTLQSYPQDPEACDGVVMFYDGLYADPLEWWVEGAKNAASMILGLGKSIREMKTARVEDPDLTHYDFASYDKGVQDQNHPDTDNMNQTIRRENPSPRLDTYDSHDLDYNPDKDEGVHPRSWPAKDPSLRASSFVTNRMSHVSEISKRSNGSPRRPVTLDEKNHRISVPSRERTSYPG